MNCERLNVVKNIAREAGDIALRHFGKLEPTRKTDNSLVTRADIEVGEFINHRLSLNFPGYGIINEEKADDLERTNKPYTWVVDPIDGTASYSARLPVWTVAIGLMKNKKPVMGMIYMPVTGEFYYADEETPAWFESPRWGKVKMDISGTPGKIGFNSLLLSVSYTHRRLEIDFPGKVRSLGSIAAHICYVARGDAVGVLLKGALWDIVPGWSILESAGGGALYIDGIEMDFHQLIKDRKSRNFMVMGPRENLYNLANRISVK